MRVICRGWAVVAAALLVAALVPRNAYSQQQPSGCEEAAREDFQALRAPATASYRGLFVGEEGEVSIGSVGQSPTKTYRYFPTRKDAEAFAEKSGGPPPNSAREYEVCPELFFVVTPVQQENATDEIVDNSGQSDSGGTQESLVDGPPTGGLSETEVSELSRSNNIRLINKSFRDSTSYAGEAQAGLTDMADDAVQALGQIVVDRATSKAYSLVENHLKKGFRCAATPDVLFQATCGVLERLRIEDIAASPSILKSALVTDVAGKMIESGARAGSKGDITSVVTSIYPLLVARFQQNGTSNLASPVDRSTLHAVIMRMLELFPDDTASQPLSRSLAVYAGLAAYAKCEALVSATESRGAERLERALPRTTIECDLRGFAQAILVAHAADSGKGQLSQYTAVAASIAQRTAAFTRANSLSRSEESKFVGFYFDLACTVERDGPFDSGLTAWRGCPSIHRLGSDANRMVKYLALGRAVVTSAMVGKSNDLIIALGRGLELHHAQDDDTDEAQGEKAQNALRIAATILHYAETYTHDSNDQSQARRKTVLESLTREMTDRDMRGGDVIFSLGGSLRAVGGARLLAGDSQPGTSNYSLYGPVDLPIGFGLDVLGKRRSHPGFHADFSVLNLGQYLTFDTTGDGTVEPPKVEDAFALSLSAGVSIGRNLPFVIVATGGYSPAADINNRPARWNVGGALGVYVPLFDFN